MRSIILREFISAGTYFCGSQKLKSAKILCCTLGEGKVGTFRIIGLAHRSLRFSNCISIRWQTNHNKNHCFLGLGNYQQQDLQYGPARGASFPSDNSYGSYGSSDPAAGYPGAAPGYAGETASFGRGSSSARGFHPYGR